ncbi:ABC transporter permease [Deinococcus metallilatus]|uniref:ABC transporter permease n=2 Tax=Deinococcus TaxID=1298 RepID=A0AAJ5JYA1_9DEIO|nr:ABC transporter permease [Deinococcus metallilatus]MBB5295202.1 peptide/nickel transport system permease protein [Deinococcus metallilatus]QBY08633.1 ABC transporter permease [Deinococcus metallilatus]RXJ10512.1 ABC transporter permease [Deinococcus metallilatus]TLK26483.1 ABC transporter permease [Deinococcus metallilatus]GMA14976.1 peptide ABC transporter permease [Deinococcus metallilatus]
MLPYIFRRVLYFIPTFLLATLLAFLIVQLAPGDFLSQLKENPSVRPETVERLRQEFGLDKPLFVQYFLWLKNFLSGNLGISFQYKRPVSEVLVGPFVNSMILVLIGTALHYAVSIPIGVYSAVRPYSTGDKVFTFFSYLFLGIPSFFFALLVIWGMLKLQQNFGWDMPLGNKTSSRLPPDLPWWRSAWDIFIHALAPSIILVLRGISSESRFLRGQMLEVLGQDYVRTARAKGVTENKVVYKHALRTALIPLIAGLGGLLPALISGAGFLEVVFNWPGLTPLQLTALNNQDIYILQAVTAIATLLYLVGNLVSDLLLSVIDPRIRYH